MMGDVCLAAYTMRTKFVPKPVKAFLTRCLPVFDTDMNSV